MKGALLMKDEGEVEDYALVKSLKEVFKEEIVKLWKITAPLTISLICQYSSFYINNIYVGKYLGNLHLSAVTVSFSVFGLFSVGVMLGMGSALETLCGQAYGAGQLKMLGTYMQRSWIVLLLSALFLLPFYILAAPILKLLGQDHDIANLAGTFTILTIPQLFSLAISHPAQKFLQAQSKVNVLAWIGFITLIEHIFLLWLFISVFDWGLVGVASAFNVTSWVTALAQLGYVLGWCKDAGSGFSWAAFNEIWAFLRLSVGSSVMICLETWYMMAITLLAGHLNNAVLAVGSLSICTNITGIQSMIFSGVRYAVSVRVSNELGLQHPRAAKFSVYVTILQSLFIGLFCMFLLFVAGDKIISIYTNSDELHQAVAKLAWLLDLSMLLNSVQPVISGVAVGVGWQGSVGYINLACFYLFGLPLGYILGYVADFGVMGIWGGMIAGTALQTLILVFLVYRTNWTTEVEETNSRIRRWGGQDNKADKMDDY
ncbi:protein DETOXIFICATION 35-like isoform X2 [Amaranthus tricolor]|uniref:protein DETOXIFICATION 35-like isoform X2 n=1 Tax=Amaranthus tricolor TaxID=29722 RepID=UPI00258ECB74|nr:protein DETOXIFICATION 35-like isoform X2 [Amaranthus tricolor]